MLDRRSPMLTDSSREAVIRVRGLEVGFDDRLILRGLDLDVYRGEILGFVGGSGQGKSVLTRTILGLIPKRAGSIEVFGEDLDALSPESRRQDRKSTRLNSSHANISYAVFCLKKKIVI